jgi:hypothetical protein
MEVLLEKLRDVDRLWKEQAFVMGEISRMHRKIRSCKQALRAMLDLFVSGSFFAVDDENPNGNGKSGR